VLFSIHDEDVPVFRLLRMRARRAPGLIEDAKEVLLKLFDADAEYSADTLEGIYDAVENVSKKVLSGNMTDALAGEVLGAIARHEDMSGRIRRNVMDTRRAAAKCSMASNLKMRARFCATWTRWTRTPRSCSTKSIF
jgi:magnesium transporter